MKDSTRKAVGIGGAICVVLGTVMMLVSGADATAVTGVVGLAAAAFAAIAALFGAVSGGKE